MNISTSVRYPKTLTVPLECQLIFESEPNLLMYTAQDVGQIADKLKRLREQSQRKTGYSYRSANGIDMPWILCEGLSKSVVTFARLKQ